MDLLNSKTQPASPGKGRTHGIQNVRKISCDNSSIAKSLSNCPETICGFAICMMDFQSVIFRTDWKSILRRITETIYGQIFSQCLPRREKNADQKFCCDTFPLHTDVHDHCCAPMRQWQRASLIAGLCGELASMARPKLERFGARIRHAPRDLECDDEYSVDD